MHHFFFNNEALPLCDDINSFIELFSNTLKAYETLVGEEKLSVAKGIITEKLPSEIELGSFILSDVIEQIPHKDFRDLAYAYFTKYPIEQHFTIDREETFLEKNYTFPIGEDNYETLYLAYVADYQGICFSVALYDELKENTLILHASNGSQLSLCNLFGEETNTIFVKNYIIELNKAQLSLFDLLLAELNDPLYPPSFEKSFLSLSIAEQQSIIDMFIRAKERNLQTPFYPDTKIIKDVTPRKPKCSVYELRVYTPTALRVYFHEGTEKVYLASIEKKSNPNQSRDIAKAHNILYKLIIMNS